MRYTVTFSDKAETYLTHLPKEIASRIKTKLLWLEEVENPRKYLRHVEGKNKDTTYRFRIGDYRAFLIIEDDKLIIIVIGIGKRENVYCK